MNFNVKQKQVSRYIKKNPGLYYLQRWSKQTEAIYKYKKKHMETHKISDKDTENSN